MLQSDDFLPVFCYRDSKSETYGPPLLYKNVGLMLRELSDQFRSGQQSVISRHPQDFAIFHIGDFNPHTGQIRDLAQKNCIGLVSDLVPEATKN